MNLSRIATTLVTRYSASLALMAVVPCVLLGQAVGGQVAAESNGTTSDVASDVVLRQKISIDLVKVTVSDALQRIAKQVHATMLYNARVTQYQPLVTVHASDEPVGTVFERVLTGTPFRVIPRPHGRFVVVDGVDSADTTVVATTTGTVAGRVVDSASGRSVSGATIKIVGTKLSAVSQDSGRFTISKVPSGEHTVLVRIFGYRPTTRPVTVTNGERVVVRIPLSAAANVLTGVVTTATGVQERRTVGNDITVINADSVLQTAPIRTLTDLLEGRVPGLTVQRTSGAAGAPARLRLRGITSGLVPGSNQSNDPILIVDGIRQYAGTSTQRDQNLVAGGYTTQSGYDQIDPNTIDKVEVFKGPSASALYGPDAANGVIVVTTKRGQAGTTLLTGAADYGINYMPGRYAGPGYYKFGHTLDNGTSRQCDAIVVGNNAVNGEIANCVLDSLVRFQALNLPRLSLFGTGNESNASVTASGGASSMTYSLTGSVSSALDYVKMPALYQDQYAAYYHKDVPAWMKRPNRYTTATGGVNLVSTPYSGLQLTVNTSLNTSNRRQSSAETSIAALSGRYIDTTVVQMDALGQYTQRVTSNTTVMNNGVTVAWNRWSQLALQAVAGQSATEEEDETLVPYGFFGPNSSPVAARTVGYYAYGRKTTQIRTVSTNAQLFPHAWVATSAGFNLIKTVPKDFSGVASPLSDGVPSPSSFNTAGQLTSSLTTAGWYMEPRFNVKSRFFVAPGFRIDNTGTYKSSVGGVAQNSGLLAALLPKMDFSWVAVDREGQRPAFGILTFLRPRVAFGISGTQPNPAQLLRNYVTGAFQPGTTQTNCNQNSGTCYQGARLYSIGNPFLHPERSRELETGFEADFWENRAQLVFSSSHRWTLDAIAQAPLAPSIGSASLLQYFNVGDVRNTSTEISFSVTPLQSRSIGWTIGASYSATKNTVIRVNGAANAVDLGNGVRAVPGYPLDGRWERPIIGYVDPGPGRPFGAADVFVGDSVAYVGSAQPGYLMPMTSSLSLWGGLMTLSVMMNYEHGFTQFGSGNIQLLVNSYLDSSITNAQKAAVVAAYCKLTKVSYNSKSECANVGTMYGLIQTVNTLRFTSMSLNYNVPDRIVQRLRLPKTSVQLQGSNLGLWTGYRGKDPDVNGTPVGEAIEDSGQQPLARSWSLRVSLSQRGHK